jgi:DNA-binding transcriptional MerR regulator
VIALRVVETESAPAPEIPDKLYFRIGEVSKLLGVEAYVVRFWETEFPGLSPKKSDTGQRLFRRKDVELLLRIKHLLYEKKFTIEGARQSLTQRRRESESPLEVQQKLFGNDPIPMIREELLSLLELLK